MSLNVLASILSERLFHTWKDTTTKSTALALQACAKVFSCFASMVQPQQLAELGPSAFYRFVRLSFQPAGQLRSPEDQHGLRSSDCCWHWLGLGESFIFHGEKRSSLLAQFTHGTDPGRPDVQTSWVSSAVPSGCIMMYVSI